jgi:Uma2 family endonuclease
MSTVAHISLLQYEVMVEAGAFSGKHRQRIELIRGELRQRNPIGTRHANVVDLLIEWSHESVPKDRVRIRCQAPLRIPALQSSPEPDLMWLTRKDYSRQHPEPTDVFLLIEVAEDSLRYDLGEKARLYAAAGIVEYWVVDIPQQAIHVHRQPQAGRYASVTVVGEQQTIATVQFSILLQPAAPLFNG